jgi:undecaprenyl-diphosphatase
MPMMKCRVARWVGLTLFSIFCLCGAGAAAQTEPTTASQSAKVTLTAFDAVVLGVIEGVTEYLPVSSTGHLLLAERFLGLSDSEAAKNASDSYAIMIQAGAILAVLGLFWKRIAQIVRGVLQRDAAGLRIGINVILAFLPAAVVGFALHSTIKKVLFGPWPIVAAWVVGGVVLILWRWKPGEDSKDASGVDALALMTPRQALIIGLMQCFAMWPGTSRSLVTILGGLLAGLPTAAAVEFSFLLGGVTLGSATVYEGLKNGREMLATFDLGPTLLGFGVSFVSAALAVKWLVAYLQKRDMAVFGYYRIALALATTVYLIWG